MRSSLIILFLSFRVCCFAQTGKEPDKVKNMVEEEPKEVVYTNVEQMPEFPGGQTEMMKYIRENMKFPDSARMDSSFTGCKTLIKFVIGSDGKVMEETIVRNCIGCIACDVEAIRLVSGMPIWKPGMQGGKAVSVSYAIPIFFNRSK